MPEAPRAEAVDRSGISAHPTDRKRLSGGCGSGFWGGQRPSLAHYVTGMGPMDGATAAGGRSCCLSSEELVAELGSAFLCADLGITPEPREDHSAYLAHWIALWYQRMVAVGEPHSHETAVRQEDVVGEEKQDLSRSHISRRRLSAPATYGPATPPSYLMRRSIRQTFGRLGRRRHGEPVRSEDTSFCVGSRSHFALPEIRAGSWPRTRGGWP